MRRFALVLGILGAGMARAEPVPNAACMTTCETGKFPECPRCEAYNVCSDLYKTDRPAYDVCMARVKVCQDEAWVCGVGRMAGQRALGACTGAADCRACCTGGCTGDLGPPHESASSWIFADLTLAPMLRHSSEDTELRVAIGLELELLLGPTTWRGRGVPFRLGPFVSAGVVVGGDDAGGQLAGGLSALVWGRLGQSGNEGFGALVLVSGGAVLDIAPGAPDRVGGLARVSVNFTTTRRSAYKPVSLGLFVEGQWIPGGAEAPDRQVVLLGLRWGPLGLVFLLVPGAGDP